MSVSTYFLVFMKMPTLGTSIEPIMIARLHLTDKLLHSVYVE